MPNILPSDNGLWCVWINNEKESKIFFVTSGSDNVSKLNTSWYDIDIQLSNNTLQVKYVSDTRVSIGKIA